MSGHQHCVARREAAQRNATQRNASHAQRHRESKQAPDICGAAVRECMPRPQSTQQISTAAQQDGPNHLGLRQPFEWVSRAHILRFGGCGVSSVRSAASAGGAGPPGKGGTAAQPEAFAFRDDRRELCHSAAPRPPFSRPFKSDAEGCQQNNGTLADG